MIGFIVAIGVFTMSFYYVVQSAVDSAGDTTVASDANVQSRAQSLADIILSPGSGWYSSTPCMSTAEGKSIDSTLFEPDGVSRSVDGVVQGRFGLGEEACLRDAMDPQAKNNLSYDKIVNLYTASGPADAANGHVDYEEARRSLGLEDGRDFHIRSWPVLATVRDVLSRGYKDPLMRPLYVGDYTEASSAVREVQHSHSVVEASDEITIRLTITNDGTTATIFATLFELPLQKNNVGFTLHTPLLASGESHTIEVTIRKSSDWVWADAAEKWVTFEIQDRDGSVGGGSIDLSGVTMTSLVKRTNVFAESENLYWVRDAAPSASIRMNYMAFDGAGSKTKFSDWALVTSDPLGLPMASLALTNNVFDGLTSQTVVQVGTYKGVIKNDLLLAAWNFDHMNLVETEDEVSSYTKNGPATYVPTAAVVAEGRYMARLVDQFDNAVFSPDYGTATVPYAAGGDIYPDLKNVMNYDLADALTDDAGFPVYDYNLMVVGSDVDHNMMTSGSAKHAIEQWVLGGGTLMVFGSDDQSIQWLQPLFHASLETANGGLQTPDEGHPVLNVPNALDYAGFKYDTQWGYNSGSDTSFTHVVTTGAGGDVMAVGNAGAFGDGRVVLTAWRAYDLVEDQAQVCPDPLTAEDECQAIFLMHNILTLAYRDLYIDYGPEIPLDSATGSQLRIVNVYHPELREVVTMQLQVFVFG